MKIMFLNKAHTTGVDLDINPCTRCMYHSIDCTHIPSSICVLYGGFQNTNDDIFRI